MESRPPFVEDPLFHAGAYYVQEASSMALEKAISPHLKEGMRALDLCAAPGGKSTHLLSILPKSSFLVSNEVIRPRANILAENILKWGYPNAVVTQNEPEDFHTLENSFDLIVVDAPCSGEGMFRKNPEAIKEWSVNAVELCAARQRKIIGSIINALKPGGLLVYSTCTFNSKEDEENAEWFAREFDLHNCSIEFAPEDGISNAHTTNTKGYKFFPHRARGEGFYITMLQKKGSVSLEKEKRKKKSRGKQLLSDSKTADQFFEIPEYLRLMEDQDQNVFAVPSAHQNFLCDLHLKLNFLDLAYPLGQVIHGKIKYGHGAAMCHSLKIKGKVHQIELEKTAALSYLMRKEIEISNAPKGWVLFTYHKTPLGWGKNLGNRVNNYYPTYFRIRKDLDLLTILD